MTHIFNALTHREVDLIIIALEFSKQKIKDTIHTTNEFDWSDYDDTHDLLTKLREGTAQ